MTTRGIRNNNPGNLEYNQGNNWKGQIGIEDAGPNSRFAVFEDPVWGIRAMSYLVFNTYWYNYGARTVSDIISRYTPRKDLTNAAGTTDAAIANISRIMGVSPTEELTRESETMVSFTKALIRQENANQQPYTEQTIRRALALMGDVDTPTTGNEKADTSQKDKPSPQASKRETDRQRIPARQPGATDASGVHILDVSRDPVTAGLRDSLSDTSSARYCFVNQEMSLDLQVFILKYSALVTNLNTEYV